MMMLRRKREESIERQTDQRNAEEER